MNRQRKVCLLIADGFGVAEENEDNGIFMANTPYWDKLREIYPHRDIHASGNFVGLPDGIMGNSEVGHLTIGSGRVSFQSLELINKAVREDTISDNDIVHAVVSHLERTGGNLHFMGLLSDGSVHSHQEHLYKLFDVFDTKMNREKGQKLFVHAFTDGRDTPPNSAYGYVEQLNSVMNKHKDIYLADVIGRFYAMDRDQRWERTRIAFDMLTLDRNENEIVNGLEEISKRYEQKEFDEFFKPIKTHKEGIIKNGDAVLFFNFRPDRARQLTMALHDQWSYDLPRGKVFEDFYYASMTQYEETWTYPTFYKQEQLQNTLAEVVSQAGMRQIHIAETEKYAHVTFFVNGGQEVQFENEERILIPSPKVATYDLQPSMSTIEIAETTAKSFEKGYELVIINFAAPDMVGHTGIVPAIIEALEVVDKGFEIVCDAAEKHGYTVLITADHGNSEQMRDENGGPHTAHTTNPVPFLITDKEATLRDGEGGLADLTPTILQLLDLEKTKEMTGISLVI